jgi:translation initiation factor IF-3
MRVCGAFPFSRAGNATGRHISRQRGGPISVDFRINERIRVPEVRLVGPGGEQVGIVRIEDALRLAEEAELDLVEVAPTARPPVCRLMDFGKFKYETAQKEREARRNQAHTVIKEMKLRPKIDPHDYLTKRGHVVRFLTAGDKVKVTIMFRGREQSRPELGFKLLQRLAEDVIDLGHVETPARQDGRNMTMVMAPNRDVKEQAARLKASGKDTTDHEAPARGSEQDTATPVEELDSTTSAAPEESSPSVAEETTQVTEATTTEQATPADTTSA